MSSRNGSVKRLVSDPDIHDKLYSDFDKLQRKKLKQQYEREAKIKEELTFKPSLMSQTSKCSIKSNN